MNNWLLIMAIGDAYAACVEFIEKHPKLMYAQIAKALEFKCYLQHPFYENLQAGSYTDDTEMSVSNAKVLTNFNYPFTKVQFAQSYIDEFKLGGKREGYASSFYKFLLTVTDGQEFLNNIIANSDKNGAAMRSIPFGIIPNIHQGLQTATIQASITHDTPAGLFSARAITLMSNFSFHESYPFTELKDFMHTYLPTEDWVNYGYIFSTDWDGGPVDKRPNKPISITTVHAVAHLLKYYNSHMHMLNQLIKWKGDTDSVAALAWGILSARSKDHDIPDFMFRDLEQGSPKTGVKYLLQIAQNLEDKYIKL